MKHDIATFGMACLRAKARPVRVFDDPLVALAQDLIETMHAANGLGLAAEQIGSDLAICVVDIPPDLASRDRLPDAADVTMPLVLVNPRITRSDGKQRSEEGCLSFPEIYAPITRATEVEVAFQDLQGRECRETVEGLTARAVQHEIDHLNGVLLVDRMSPAQRVALAGPLRKLRMRGARPTAS